VLLAEPLDQATGLRRLFTAAPPFHAVGILSPDPARGARASLVLARGLSQRAGRVLVIDEARPPQNVGGQIGVLPRPLRIGRETGGLEGIALGGGVELINLQAGMHDLAALDEESLIGVTETWDTDAPEWMLVHGDAAGLAALADLRVLVVPGSRTRLAQAYALMKSALAIRPDGPWQVLVIDAEADVAEALFRSLAETAQRFLRLSPAYLGCLPRQPAPGFAAALSALLTAPAGSEPQGFVQFWRRAWLLGHASQAIAPTKVRHARRP